MSVPAKPLVKERKMSKFCFPLTSKGNSVTAPDVVGVEVSDSNVLWSYQIREKRYSFLDLPG